MQIRKTIAACAIAWLSVASAGAGTVLRMVEKNASGATTSRSTTTIDADRLRMDLDVDGDASKTSAIYRGDRGELMLLDHGAKTATIIDRAAVEKVVAQLEQARAQLEQALANVPESQRKMMENMMKSQMEGLVGSVEPFEVEKTSETGTTNGYPWTKYEVTQGGALVNELFVTDPSNLDIPSEDLAVFQSMMAFFQDFIDSVGKSLPGAVEMPFVGIDRLDGFPVASQQYEDGTMTGRSELASVESADVPGDRFDNPGYEVRRVDPERQGR